MHLKPELKDEVRELLKREGGELGSHYVARRVGRRTQAVQQVLRELRHEEPELFGSHAHDTYRDHDTDIDIPIDWDDDRPTVEIPVPPACRIHVEKPVANYTLPALDCGSELERLLLIPDTHSPMHDKYAWAAMMRFAREWRPHTLVHLGDLADCYSISDHNKDPRRAHNLIEECAVTNGLLDELDDLGAVRKVFCEGNHSERLSRYLMQQAPALLGAVSMDGLLRFQERGWLYVPYRQHGRIGDLHVTHDVGKSGQNAVHQTAMAVGHNIAFGHTHRLALEYFGTVLGERYVSMSCGWLGDAEAATYISAIAKAQWQTGFGVAVIEKNGNFRMNPIPIIGHRVVGNAQF